MVIFCPNYLADHSMTKYRQKVEKILSSEKIEILYAEYMSGSLTNSELCDKYNLDIHPNKIFQVFPHVLSDLNCPHCATQMHVRRPSRVPTSVPTAYCSACGHKDSLSCSCSGCSEARRMQSLYDIKQSRKKQLVCDASAFNAYPYSDLRWEEKLLLLSLVVSGEVNDRCIVMPLKGWPIESAWGGDRLFYLRDLAVKQIVSVNSNGAESTSFSGVQASTDMNTCYWRINVRENNEMISYREITRKLRFELLSMVLPIEVKYVLAEMVTIQVLEHIVQGMLSSRFERFTLSKGLRDELKHQLRHKPIGKVCMDLQMVCRDMINYVSSDALTKESANSLLESGLKVELNASAWWNFMPTTIPASLKLVVEGILKVSMRDFVNKTIAEHAMA